MINHQTGQVLAYVLATHEDEAFIQLEALLEPFGILHFYSDGWGAAYVGVACRRQRHIEPIFHSIGKRNTQKIEHKPLTPSV